MTRIEHQEGAVTVRPRCRVSYIPPDSGLTIPTFCLPKQATVPRTLLARLSSFPAGKQEE